MNGDHRDAGTLHGTPVIMLVDPSDPNAIVVGGVPAASLVSGMDKAGGELYASSPDGLSIYDIGTLVGEPITVSVPVPKGTGVSVVAGSFNEPPDQFTQLTQYLN